MAFVGGSKDGGWGTPASCRFLLFYLFFSLFKETCLKTWLSIWSLYKGRQLCFGFLCKRCVYLPCPYRTRGSCSSLKFGYSQLSLATPSLQLHLWQLPQHGFAGTFITGGQQPVAQQRVRAHVGSQRKAHLRSQPWCLGGQEDANPNMWQALVNENKDGLNSPYPGGVILIHTRLSKQRPKLVLCRSN